MTRMQCKQDPAWHGELGARLKAHWRYKVIAGSILAVSFNLAYFLVLYFPVFPVTEMPVTAIDEMIGFWSMSLSIYMTLWIYIAMSAWLLTDRQELGGYIKAMAGLSMVGLAFFFFWPTSVPRPVIDLEKYPSFKYLVAIDEPRNVFPSLHAAFAAFCAISIGRTSRQWGIRPLFRVLNWCWCIAIVYSALATKQHLAVDLLAGGVLGIAWAWGYGRSLSGLQTKNRIHSGEPSAAVALPLEPASVATIFESSGDAPEVKEP